MKACTQCGKCCLNDQWMNTLDATGDDVKRWRREGRRDILRHAVIIGPKDNPYADLWVTADGGEVKRCPFVRKIRNQDRYTCTIYETRPAVCRGFPYDVMHTWECDMIEVGDTQDNIDRFMGRSVGEDIEKTG